MGEPTVIGIGIDLEPCDALMRLDETALRRAAGRWFTPAERAWCSGQPSLGESMVVLFCCKEAAFKAWNGAGAAHTIGLTLDGSSSAGWARSEHPAAIVGVHWRRWHGQVLALAVAIAPDRHAA